MFQKVLIANRGVAAVRIAQTLYTLGVQSVALRADSEKDAGYFDMFDQVVDLGDGSLADTYLNQDKVVSAALESGAEAIHPGYGFLSENAEFAQRVQDAGLVFIGPDPATIRAFGLKHEARRIAQESDVMMLPGTPLLETLEQAVHAAEEIGYPVILKSSAGGGGIGMQACYTEDELRQAFDSVRSLAAANFSSAGVFLEKLLQAPRHVEVQIFGDGKGGAIVLGDRDCSLQRRHQKLIEECPAPNISDTVRRRIHGQAQRLAQAVKYASAGTVEFLYDPQAEQFYFLEVNTRIQVEHGVTEMVYGVDLVAWMVKLASGDMQALAIIDLQPQGAAIQGRFYAEDPYDNFRPTPGGIDVQFPEGVRTDTWLTRSDQVSHQFDPLLANVICFAETREQARMNLVETLQGTQCYGIATNRIYLANALKNMAFRDAIMHTGTLAEVNYAPNEIEVVQPGFQTQVQAYPGRQGYWEVGVPPSGPMDDVSFRIANRLVGNADSAAALEITFSGPSLLFRQNVLFAVCGAEVELTLDGEPVEMWRLVPARPGALLEIGQVSEGMRCYLAIAGGLDVKSVMGSPTTFTLGQMGGHDGRCLRVTDVLRWHADRDRSLRNSSYQAQPLRIGDRTKIRVLPGPHTAPEFFTETDIETIFSATWKVHHNSSRTGVRLVGPQPEWARADGGEAGLHPSNIHDNAYAFGAIDFTGDMPVILGPDGPSLGGFVCPGVVINADRWKLGQLQPGDELHLIPVSKNVALQAQAVLDQYIESGREPENSLLQAEPITSPILWQSQSEPGLPMMIRRAGQEWLLVEFGAPVLDIKVRAAVHRFVNLIRDTKLSGIVEMTPGIRSLQIRFDQQVWSGQQLIEALKPLIAEAITGQGTPIASRRIRLPLSWDDPACQLAIERYVSAVRSDAPWCPDNIEFIRRINGLSSKAAVRDIVFSAKYLVMGLGDVYLGAPVMTPLDPRHRLVTTKYNPARTWTAENSVGIGGAYMCIYGMEGPGGYQFVGRTTPVWRTEGFTKTHDRAWLLNHFDQVEYYPVDAEDLLEMRAAAKRGAFMPEIEHVSLDLDAYEETLAGAADEIAAFQTQRAAGFAAEMERWQAAGLHKFVEQEAAAERADVVYDGYVVASPMAASVWKLNEAVLTGAESGMEILLLEAMKSEVSVRAPQQGRVEFLVEEGQMVEAGQPLALIH